MKTRFCLTSIASALLLTACGPGAEAPVTAAEITPESICVLDGMTLADYPGPKAQIHYEGQPAPDMFCDTMEMFSLLTRPEQSRKVRAAFVQDMGKAEWNSPKGAWIEAHTASYVVGSKKHGSMGPTVASFASAADAQKFAEAFGGKVFPFSGITPEMARLDGGALHDKRM